jgi:TonB family protein
MRFSSAFLSAAMIVAVCPAFAQPSQPVIAQPIIDVPAADAASAGAPICTRPPLSAGHFRAPTYPPSLTTKPRGTTLLDVTIASDGSPQTVQIRNSSGTAQLDSIALDQIQNIWRWQPLAPGCATATTTVAVIWRPNLVIATQIVPRPPYQPPPDYLPDAASAATGCSADSKAFVQMAKDNGYRYSDPCAAPWTASQQATATGTVTRPMQASAAIPPLADKTAQTDTVAAALRASPSLMRQVRDAAAARHLSQVEFHYVNGAAMRGIGVNGTTITITHVFLAEQANNHLFDVVHQNEIYPNSLVFVLGHLMHHLAYPGPDSKAFIPKGFSGGDITQPALQFLNASMANEAQCYFQGWNDMIEAAVQENGGPLTQQQIADIVLNFRYRETFLRAMGLPKTTAQSTDEKLVLQRSGAIATDDQNVKAMVAALRATSVPDFEPLPIP